MQVCFVLAADGWNRYASMACVAAASVRRWLPECRVLLLCDELTAARLDGHRTRLAAHFDEVVSIPVPVESGKDRSRYLKTTMRRWLRGDFAYLDVDVLALDSVAPLFRVAAPVGLTVEGNASPSEVRRFPRVAALYERLGWGPVPQPYFNGGMMWVRDDAAASAFFERWHACWQITRAAGSTDDQPSLNRAVVEAGLEVEVLSPEWNAMVLFAPSRWRGCRIAHFFASNPFPSTVLAHLVNRFERDGVIDWQVLDRCIAEGHPWGPDPEPWQLWRSGHYGRALAAKCGGLLGVSVRNRAVVARSERAREAGK
jgi:hypothetical protein